MSSSKRQKSQSLSSPYDFSLSASLLQYIPANRHYFAKQSMTKSQNSPSPLFIKKTASPSQKNSGKKQNEEEKRSQRLNAFYSQGNSFSDIMFGKEKQNSTDEGFKNEEKYLTENLDKNRVGPHPILVKTKKSTKKLKKNAENEQNSSFTSPNKSNSENRTNLRLVKMNVDKRQGDQNTCLLSNAKQRRGKNEEENPFSIVDTKQLQLEVDLELEMSQSERQHERNKQIEYLKEQEEQNPFFHSPFQESMEKVSEEQMLNTIKSNKLTNSNRTNILDIIVNSPPREDSPYTCCPKSNSEVKEKAKNDKTPSQDNLEEINESLKQREESLQQTKGKSKISENQENENYEDNSRDTTINLQEEDILKGKEYEGESSTKIKVSLF